MTAQVLMPQYLRRPGGLRGGRVLVFMAIGLIHVVAIGGLFITRSQPTPPVPTAMMVSFISEQPKPPEPPPPEPKPEPVKPDPKPRMAATTKPTPSAIEAPPIEEPEPVEETPPPPPQAEPGPPEPVVIPPNFVAAYLNNPAPAYPQMSIRLREEGTVLLLVLVSPGGTADQVRVEQSSGFSRLDAAAVDVVKKRWRFVAAKQGDQPVTAWVKIPLSFELKKH